MKPSEFQELVDQLDAESKQRSKARHKVILVAGKESAAKRGDCDDDQLTKALTSAAPVIGSKAACHLDLLRRQGALPANVRTALLSLDTTGGEA